MMAARKVLREYQHVSPGQPVLYGHIIVKIMGKNMRKKTSEWATAENEKNGFPPVSENIVRICKRIFDKLSNYPIEEFVESCRKVAAQVRKILAPRSTNPPTKRFTTRLAEQAKKIKALEGINTELKIVNRKQERTMKKLESQNESREKLVIKQKDTIKRLNHIIKALKENLDNQEKRDMKSTQEFDSRMDIHNREDFQRKQLAEQLEQFVKKQEIEFEIEFDSRMDIDNREGLHRKQLAKHLEWFVTENPSVPADLLSQEHCVDFIEELVNILKGDILGRDITHFWSEGDNESLAYKGRVNTWSEDMDYVISYTREDLEDVEELELSRYEIAADYLCKDLFFN